jgi:predicted GIY-YIG superfamily endonuclease
MTGRLADHNAGPFRLTADGRPWNIDLVVEFTDETRALKFERYLKSGSGVAFAKRHFVTTHHAQQRFDPMLPDSQRAPK